jgi:hypothetical protein
MFSCLCTMPQCGPCRGRGKEGLRGSAPANCTALPSMWPPQFRGVFNVAPSKLRGRDIPTAEGLAAARGASMWPPRN